MIQSPPQKAESNVQTGDSLPPGPLRNVNPEMIAMARLASGLTQTECAKAIGISQAKLSKLEDGLTTTIENEALTRFSKLSGYPMEFFSQTGNRMPLGEGFFRRRADIPAKVFAKMEALVNLKRIELGKILRKVELEHKERPAWDVDDFREGPREIARHLRHFWSIPNGPIPNLVEIVEDAGCVVVFFNFGTSKIDGLTIYADNGTPVILLNPDVPYVRQRATLSHELGHVIMHRVPSGTMDDEAFAFASEFMMPEHEIRPAFFPLNLEKLVRLKLKWRVSIQWILKWARSLGAVKDSYYRVLMMKISQNGWRKCEPYDSEWDAERPSTLDEAIRYCRHDLGYSEEDLLKSLNANVRTFSFEYLKVPTLSVI